MSTLAVVEQILKESGVPMSVKEIVQMAGDSLPTRSRTPDTVVARDLSVNIKKLGEKSRFARTAPGRYTMRSFVPSFTPASHSLPSTECISATHSLAQSPRESFLKKASPRIDIAINGDSAS